MVRVLSLVVATIVAAWAVLGPQDGVAQEPGHQHQHPHDHTAGADHAHHSHAGAPVDCRTLVAPPWIGLSDGDRQQIEQLRQSVAHLSSPEAAIAAGFRPLLGNIPGMGVHYVHAGRTATGVNPDEPDHLLFAPVDGEEQLVGVAYAFRDVIDTDVPLPFESDLAHWHDHPELGGPGQTLHMLHVWFVPSSNGPFAGLNFWLPFRGAGIEPPSACWIESEADFERIQQVSFALAATQRGGLAFGGLFGGRAIDREALRSALAGAGAPDLAGLADVDPARIAALLEQFAGRAGARGDAALGARRAAAGAGAGAVTAPPTAQRVGLIEALDAASRAGDRDAWTLAADAFLADLTDAERVTINAMLRSLTLAQLSTPEREAIRSQTEPDR